MGNKRRKGQKNHNHLTDEFIKHRVGNRKGEGLKIPEAQVEFQNLKDTDQNAD